MSFTIFLAVMAAAFLHAVWNAGIKTGANKQTAMMILTVCQGVTGVMLAVWMPLPAAHVWPWLLASGVVHMVYQLFLAYAYEQGDLSRVYPLARGTAPILVMLFSLMALSDPIGGMEYAGAAVLGLGIMLMAWGALASGENRRLVPYALGAATATAAYTVIDGLGARVAGNPVQFVAWVLLMSGMFYIPAVLWLKGPTVLKAARVDWLRGAFGGSASMLAYGIVLWAMTEAPIALVAALRETSILFAMLIGWLWFGDKMGLQKALAGALIVGGVVLTRL